jgi:F-type H+-transporting ATPase subunit b
MISIDWTILVAGAVFLLTLWLLNKCLFTPLLRVLDERRAKTTGLREEASRKLEYEAALFQEYSEKIKAEKRRGYQLAESARREAVDQRQEKLVGAREESETLVRQAKAEIELEVDKAKQKLEKDAEEMAAAIAVRVLEKA